MCIYPCIGTHRAAPRKRRGSWGGARRLPSRRPAPARPTRKHEQGEHTGGGGRPSETIRQREAWQNLSAESSWLVGRYVGW